MQKSALAATSLALFLIPALALAQEPQALKISGSAVVEGASVPIEALVSTGGTSGAILSDSKKEGAVPVTITVYLSPKPKPAVSTNSQTAAAVESSQKIQETIAGVSPQVADVTEPFFTLIDSARSSAADIVDTQLSKTKVGLGADAGKVLSAQATKNAASNPGGTAWFILQTLYLYLLTILGFIIGTAGVFYPLFAIVVLYLVWKLFRRFRRPAY